MLDNFFFIANGAFQGNYRQLLEKAASLVTSDQVPQYNEYGPVSELFQNSRPFQIARKDFQYNQEWK